MVNDHVWKAKAFSGEYIDTVLLNGHVVNLF